jgi:hypothetical protein
MNLREKILAGAAGAVVLGWMMSSTLYSWFLQPFDDVNFKIRGLNTEIKKLDDDEFKLIKAQSGLRDARAISLPPDPLDAQRIYQRWLTDLATLTQFKDLKVVPNRRINKANVYVAVQVTIDGTATLEQLASFLYLFERVNLLHRVTEISVESKNPNEESPLTVHIIAEGLSVAKSTPRESIFPRIKLMKPVTAKDVTMTIDPKQVLPLKAPFHVIVGQEIMVVTQVDTGLLSIQRGQERTVATEHDTDHLVELMPWRAADEKNAVAMKDWSAYKKLLSQNPFVKYRAPEAVIVKKPKLKALNDISVNQGTAIHQVIGIDDWKPELGPANITVTGELPEGLKLIPEKNEFVWEDTAKVTPGSYPVSLVVTSKTDPEVNLKGSFRITIKGVNYPPVIEQPNMLTTYPEQPYNLYLKATDPDANQKLTYAITDSKIPNTTIDATTGVLKITPPKDLPLGTYSITVTATDDGNPPTSSSIAINVPVSDDAARQTFLVANILDDQKKMIWLYNRLDNQRYELKELDLFSVADLFGGVARIEYDYAILVIDGVGYRIQTGQNMREMVPEPTPKEEATVPVKSDAMKLEANVPVKPMTPAATSTTPVAPVTPTSTVPDGPDMKEPISTPVTIQPLQVPETPILSKPEPPVVPPSTD